MWTDYVKTGTPSPPGSPVDWRPVAPGYREWLGVDRTGGMTMARSADHEQRMAFWDSIFPTGVQP